MMAAELDNPFAEAISSAASPRGTPGGRELLEALAFEGYRQGLESFVRQAPSVIDLPAGLLDTLAQFAQDLACFEEVWHPSLGALSHAKRNPEPAFLCTAAAEMALRAHARGVPGLWRLSFPKPAILPVGGFAIRNVAEVFASGRKRTTRLEFVLATGERQIRQIEARADSWDARIREPALATFGHRTDEDTAATLPVTDPGMGEALRAAFQLLDVSSPSYADWVRGAVRQVAPLRCNGNVVASWSSLHYPGLISLTIFDSALDMAETLVHEASHQRYHMLDRTFPMVQPWAVQELCWSPIKQCLRPLPMLLLAFHAFGNIALFFHELRRQNMLDGAAFAFHMVDLRRWLPAMADTLHCTHGLTPDGRSLWQDLYSYVAPALSLDMKEPAYER